MQMFMSAPSRLGRQDDDAAMPIGHFDAAFRLPDKEFIDSSRHHGRIKEGRRKPAKDLFNTIFAQRSSRSQVFACRYSRVAMTPSRIERRGSQPIARILAVSRKMNGLSPIQPRSPPV